MLDWEAEMTDSADKEAIEYVMKADKSIFELYRVRQYKGFRRREDGVHSLRIEILEDLRDDPGVRFQALVTDEKTSARASGNGGDSIREALAVVHWGDLDKK
jgi:hypothetical protein